MNIKNSFFILAFIAGFVWNGFGQKAQQPSIMVIPSDELLNRLGCIDLIEHQGRMVKVRNFDKAFLESSDLRFIITGINETFAGRGFPIEDLEQTLKGLQNRAAFDNLENYDFDPKAMVLSSARPDIVLDLSYKFNRSGFANTLMFNMQALDAYTFKAIAGAADPGIETSSSNVPMLMKEAVENNMNNVQQLMMNHFQDLRTNGREVTLRIKVEDGAVGSLKRERCGTGKPYSRYIADWLKKNTVNGYGKRDVNSDKELFYSQIRIPLYDNGGYPIAAADWSEGLLDALLDDCNIIAIDNSTGLGEATIVFLNE